MNGQMLELAGKALYPDRGDDWVSAFARRFCLNDRSVRRMHKDIQPVPPTLRDEIYAALSVVSESAAGVMALIEAEIAAEAERS